MPQASAPLSEIHIDIALQAAVVELALFCGLLAEVVLKFRLGGDDILFPPVGKAQVAAELPHELLRTALLEHTLAIGRVGDYFEFVCGRDIVPDIAALGGDIELRRGFLRVGQRERYALAVDIVGVNVEILVGGVVGSHHVESAIAAADSRRENSAGAVDLIEHYLAGSGEHIAYLLPVNEV